MVGSVKDTLVSSDMYIKLSNTTHLSELLFNNDLVVPMGQMSQHALQTLEILSLTAKPFFLIIMFSMSAACATSLEELK